VLYMGIDRGRGFTKVVSGGRRVVFPSLVAPSHTRKLVSEGPIIENLEVEVDGRKYFVGDLAAREGGAALTIVKDTVSHEDTLPLILTACVSLVNQPEEEIRLVTGLQIADFTPETKAAYRDLLNGEHIVRLKGYATTLKIAAEVFPQAGAVLFGKLLDEEGKVCDHELAGKQLGVIDIGYRDVNIAVMDRSRYVDRMSTSFPVGMYQCYLSIAGEINLELGSDLLPHELPWYMERHEVPNTEHHYQALAKRIVDLVMHYWPNPTQFHVIFLAGGGSVPLEPYLKRYFPQARLMERAQFANAEGFYKLAKKRWSA